MNSGNKKLFIVLAFSIAVSSFSFYFYQVLFSPNFLVGMEKNYVNIPDEATFRDVQKILIDKKIVSDMMSFSFLAKIMSYDRHIKPGHYQLKPDMSNRAVLRGTDSRNDYFQ